MRQLDPFSQLFRRSFWASLVVGLGFIGFAVLVLYYPRLLAIPMAFIFFVIGAYILRFSWKIYHTHRKAKGFIDRLFRH